jgi:hypothetical protein
MDSRTAQICIGLVLLGVSLTMISGGYGALAVAVGGLGGWLLLRGVFPASKKAKQEPLDKE